MTGDPVSWKVVETGWRVVAADGQDVGRVDRVLGDANIDIFNGIAVSHGLLARPRYVPAERVGTITEGCVELALTADEFERLDESHEPPPSERLLS